MRSLLLYVLPAFLLGCSSGNSGTRNDAGDDASDAGNDAVEEQVNTADGPAVILQDGGFDMIPNQTGPLVYHGGAAVVSPLTVHFIFYGSWTYAPTTASLLQYLVAQMGTNPWWQTTKHYYQQTPYWFDAGTNTVDAGDASSFDAGDAGNNSSQYQQQHDIIPETTQYVSGALNLGTTINVDADYNNGTLDIKSLQNIIQNAISAGQLPLDPNAAYVVVMSKDIYFNDIYQGIFCWDFCGFHDHFQYNNTDVKYAFVGDPMQCPGACSLQLAYSMENVSNSPNDNWSADALASPLMHELHELATDPDWDNNPGWQAPDYSYETGDACAWTFGFPFLTPNNSIANIEVGNKYFMIQKIWDLTANNGNGACVMPK